MLSFFFQCLFFGSVTLKHLNRDYALLLSMRTKLLTATNESN